MMYEALKCVGLILFHDLKIKPELLSLLLNLSDKPLEHAENGIEKARALASSAEAAADASQDDLVWQDEGAGRDFDEGIWENVNFAADSDDSDWDVDEEVFLAEISKKGKTGKKPIVSLDLLSVIQFLTKFVKGRRSA